MLWLPDPLEWSSAPCSSAELWVVLFLKLWVMSHIFSVLGCGPDNPWITSGAIHPLPWRIMHVHSWIAVWSHPLKFEKSDNLPSLHPISISFSSNWPCSSWWLICSVVPPMLISLSNGQSSTHLMFSSEHAFSYFVLWTQKTLHIFMFWLLFA